MPVKVKIIKYSLISILILIVAFFAIGMINPSFTYESKILVNSSKANSWDVFRNKELMEDWMLDLAEVKLLKGKEGEKGSEYEFLFVQNDEEVRVREVVTEFDPPNKYSFSLTAEVLSAETVITFEESDGVTEIVSRTLVKPKGMIFRTLFILTKNTFKEQSDLQYLELKRVIESNNLIKD